MTRFCWNAIVKNEVDRIERAMRSVAPYITSYAVLDTGSTDGTQEKIRNYFTAQNIPGVVADGKFVNFSQARNDALALARRPNNPKSDYLLLMDADMELVVKDVTFANGLTGPSYDMYQESGALQYQNRRLVKTSDTGVYRGVTHEYLDVHSAGLIPAAKAYFNDYADGSNRPEKFKRDIALLLEGLKEEPDNARYYFYLAQSYRDARDCIGAAHWYKRRVEAGGWDEEVWNAQLNLAHCYLDLGNEAEFIRNLLIAYNMRPARSESLYDLAKYYRMKGENNLCALFSETGLDRDHSDDALFVNDYVYKVGMKEEFAIAAYYVPEKRAKGFNVCNELMLKAGPYGGARELARTNVYWYIPKAAEVMPSFKWQNFDFEAPEHWIALNPSITTHKNKLYAIVRTVNYRIDPMGRYIIRATDGTANDSNPINTRNYFLELSPHLKTLSKRELVAPVDMPPPLFKPVIGFEDMRLFFWKGQPWTSSCVRELNEQGYCEQVRTRLPIDNETSPLPLDSLRVMQHLPRAYEKNWAPVVDHDGDYLSFMYRLGEMVDAYGRTYKHTPLNLECSTLSGGSQLVRINGGWLSLVHEARYRPGSPLRYYSHRIVYFDLDFTVRKISKPFVFNEKEIEFAAGMCINPLSNDLVISYGFNDKEARIGTVSQVEALEWLWHG
jgi:glycosyltransferase involved in cell wall biosynthesis